MPSTESAPEIAEYPVHRSADIVLRDGSTVHVRPIKPEDEPRLLRFFRELSEESLTLRFFSPAVNLPAEARRESHVDYRRSYGLVAIAAAEDRLVGHGYYSAIEEHRAEVAFAIAESHQGRGLGTILLAHLAEHAAANDIHVFEAEVLPYNRQMIDVFRRSGFPLEIRAGLDQIVLTFPTELTPEALERFDQREQIAAANTLRAFLYPRSVAVIGASRERGTPGGEMFHNLLGYGFHGPVYPVNPSAGVVQSVLAYPTVEAIAGPVDLAVVAVPAARVVEVAEQCGRKGVRAMVVISAGFAESGPEGRARQDALLEVCRATGMRLVGPNCIGIVNTDPAVRLNSVFTQLAPRQGRVGFASQSGALGLAAINYAASLGLGISSFVSMGNKADISGNDVISYLESDPSTDVILLYLESFGNPRKFSRIARRVARRKPIIAVKSGRSAAGARATSSHTGALLAASDVTVDALFRQTGVIRTDTFAELFDVTALLASQPLPPGRRVGIVTNVGGPAVLCVDACEAQGLTVPVLDEATQARLRGLLAPAASVVNPVDLLASGTPDQYNAAIRLVASDPNVDAVIALFIPPLARQTDVVAAAILDAARSLDRAKPVLSVFMVPGEQVQPLGAGDLRVPRFVFPESAAMALARVCDYAEWRRRPDEPVATPEGIRRDEAVAIVAAALGRGGGWLPPDDVIRLLDCYRLPTAEQRIVHTPAEAAAAAEALGGRVALKAFIPGLLHKTDVGGVRLGLRGATPVRRAAEEMAARFGSDGDRPPVYVVQRMIADGVETIVGIVNDRQFGPVLACGAGGVLVELVKDVSVRLTPVTPRDAGEMVRSLKSFPLLVGYRGAPARDVAALEDVLVRVSALAEDLPQVAELDCNPVMVLEHGAVIVDARIRVEAVAPPRPLGARR